MKESQRWLIAGIVIPTLAIVVAALAWWFPHQTNGNSLSNGDSSSTPTATSNSSASTVTNLPSTMTSHSETTAVNIRKGTLDLPRGHFVDLDSAKLEDEYFSGADLEEYYGFYIGDIPEESNITLAAIGIRPVVHATTEGRRICNSTKYTTWWEKGVTPGQQFCVRTDEGRMVLLRILREDENSGAVSFSTITWSS